MMELSRGVPFEVIDHHLHTTWSDGHLQLADVVAIAERHGRRIGISDHAGPRQAGIQQHNVDAYLRELSKYPVYRGVEMDVAYGLTFDEEKAAKLDYIIGSLHGFMRNGRYVPMDGVFHWFQTHGPYRPDVDLSDPELWVEEWFSILEHCFANTPIDILGHATVTPVLPLHPDPAKAYRPEWEEALCTLLLRFNVALEINGRYKLPHERLLRTAREMGVVFAIGSDGHHRHHICDLAYPLQMVEKLRVPPEQIFDIENKPRKKPMLQFSSLW